MPPFRPFIITQDIWNVYHCGGHAVDEIKLGQRQTKALVGSANQAIEEGDLDLLGEDILSIFSDEQVVEIESRLDGGSLEDLVEEIINEWTGDDLQEFIEIVEDKFAAIEIEIVMGSLEDFIEDDSYEGLDYEDEDTDEVDEFLDDEDGFHEA